MSKYFNLFPIITYDQQKTRNITLSGKLVESLEGVSYLYYTIRDGERPDTIAHDYYGDSNLSWLILMSNRIIDPYHNWPLSLQEFNARIAEEFISIENAVNTISHYKQKEDIVYFRLADPTDIIDVNEFNSQSDKSAWKLLKFDEGITISIESFAHQVNPINFKSVSVYDREFDDNETKRTIRILSKEHVNMVITKLRELLNND